ncbi:hypothetical protein J6590_030424 [Homalodisca vitripennis]|nr:hypothetical protein J6590_030424 [Homalodisca vitripennis]
MHRLPSTSHRLTDPRDRSDISPIQDNWPWHEWRLTINGNQARSGSPGRRGGGEEEGIIMIIIRDPRQPYCAADYGDRSSHRPLPFHCRCTDVLCVIWPLLSLCYLDPRDRSGSAKQLLHQRYHYALVQTKYAYLTERLPR